MKKYSIVIVVHSADLKIAKQNIPIIYRMVEPKKIVLISHSSVRSEITKMKRDYIEFIDENTVIPNLDFNAVKNAILGRTVFTERTGWYFQQFLKMAYAYICEDDWYLLWDADTIPLRKISFMKGKNQGILDIKTEYHKPYFWTLYRLLGIKKGIKGSFISEHMLINKKVMLDMIKKIENNMELEGNYFFEKVISSVKTADLRGSGFSEFETYGNFVLEYYPEMYTLRKLKTLREAKILLGDQVNEKVLRWGSKSYDIVSFEKRHNADPACCWLANSFFRYFFSMETMWKMYKMGHKGNYYE